MKRHLHRKMRIWLCSLVCGLWAMPLLANRSALPDSLITEDKVYEFTFSDTPLAERIMMELRKKGKQATHELDITEGDLYYNTGRFIIAASFYKNALAAKAVKRDEQMTMKLLHRLISCYDGLYDEKRKAETVKLLMQNAQEAGDSGMESIALFYLGKSLHEQGTKERGYVYMLQATEMMEKSHYDRKYDNLRANCNDLLICYERDKRYGEALQVLDKLEKYLYAKTPGEAEMEGLYEQEKCKWLAHRAVVCSKLGKEKEANEAYSEFQKMGRINRRYAYLVVPYLFDLHRYDEIVDMCKQRETEMMHKKDTINLYMSSTLKFYGMAYQGLEQYDKAASYFERLSVLRDSLRVRELRSSSQELSIIYDVKDKEAQITHQRWELVIAICILIALAIIGCVLGYNNRIIRKKNISLVANVKEAMRYKEELEKLNRSLCPKILHGMTMRIQTYCCSSKSK